MRISIIGAGNAGQAMAGHFTLLGHDVKLYNRSAERIEHIVKNKKIQLIGELDATVVINTVTTNIELALKDAELIMVATTADAHRALAQEMAPFLMDGQTIILNPGRTFGAIEFSSEIKKYTNSEVFIGEAQSLIYACRIEEPDKVRIIGVKEHVMLAAYPSKDTDYVLQKINQVVNCFDKAANVLETSLENIGAIFHPSVILFNAAAIERGSLFYFYSDMTPTIAEFLLKIDQERIDIGKAFDIELIGVSEWISYAYEGVKGSSLLEKMKNNPAYDKILAPKTLHSRLLLEDVPTGVLPMIELGKFVGVPTPLLKSVFEITQILLNKDFIATGRTLKNLGIEGKTKKEFLAIL